MSLTGKLISLSGRLSQPRETIISMIKNNNGQFASNINKNVTHLIVSDPTLSTSKVKSARMKGIEIVGEDWLTNMIKPQAEKNKVKSAEKNKVKSAERNKVKSARMNKVKSAEKNKVKSARMKGTEVVGSTIMIKSQAEKKEQTPTSTQQTLDATYGLESSSKPLSGMIICLTGRLSKKKEDYAQIIAANGGTYSNTVTKKVTHVIAKEPDAASAKLDKARRYGAKIVGENFISGLEGDKKESNKSSVVELREGQTIKIKGSSGRSYEVKKSGGVTYCNCPGWRNQSLPVDLRTCKHLNQLFGKELETDRVANVLPANETKAKAPPKVLLANKYDKNKHQVGGWWVSEKLDGVRAWWDGEKFWSRLGNMFYAPEWFRDAMPKDQVLDGELFMGRRMFQETISVVRSQDESDRWKDITFMVFDVPSQGKKPFEARIQVMKEVCHNRPYTQFVEQRMITPEDDIAQMLKEIEELGGEGLMLRAPKSKYVGTRSNTLLKVKSFKDDEAKIIGYATEGKGRLKGMTGSLLVVNRDGKKFKVGSGLTDQLRETPPPIGAIITYKYQELTKAGKPRFPTYVGLAIDKEFP